MSAHVFTGPSGLAGGGPAGPAGLDPAAHVPAAVHGPGTPWPETNCALDLYLELLNVTGRQPEALGVVAFSADFLGDAWVTLKPGSDDLWRHGLSVVEYNTWRPILEHVTHHLDAGRLMTVETDSWWLPDTAGTAYRADHVKTSITPLRVDPEARTMTYLHNAGCYVLAGEDFEALWSEDVARTWVPIPYLELVTLAAAPDPGQLRAAAGEALRAHLDRAPATNPVVRLRAFLLEQLPALAGDEPAFHKLAFVTTRQFGATAQLGAGFLRWWAPDDARIGEAADLLADLAERAGHAQFVLARAARGRRVDPDALLAGVAEAWDTAVGTVRAAARDGA